MEELQGFLLICAYFAPAIIAAARKHSNVGPIVVVNVLLGWTIIGWIVALAWCLSSSTRPTRVIQAVQPEERSSSFKLPPRVRSDAELQKLVDAETARRKVG
jgi:hypothetical protein